MKLDHIALVVSDIDKTVNLYKTTLGATLVSFDSEYKGPPETTLMIGDVKLVLVSGEQSSKNSDSHIAFTVCLDDLDEIKKFSNGIRS